MAVSLALDAQCELGEGPIWDDREQILYFVDITRNTIHSFKPEDNSHSSLVLDEPVGAVALTSDPSRLLAATRRSVLVVRFWGEGRGVERTLAETPEEDGVGHDIRFNDCKVTPRGTVLCGRMHGGWRKGHRGRLYALEPGATTFRQIMGPEEVGLPNGMAWSADGSICYFVDSAEETITAYPTEVSTAAPKLPLAPRTVAHNPTGHEHVPDGMTIDSEGNLWVALGESGSVVCYSSVTGKELKRVALPVARPTSCQFGGPELMHLYVTTRVESGDGASPHHGGLFRVAIPGIHGIVKGAAPDAVYPLGKKY